MDAASFSAPNIPKILARLKAVPSMQVREGGGCGTGEGERWVWHSALIEIGWITGFHTEARTIHPCYNDIIVH